MRRTPAGRSRRPSGSCTRTSKPRCTSRGTVIVHSSVHAEFVKRFSAAVSSADHHTVIGSTGRVGPDNPREGFIGDPSAGLYYHPVIVDGVRSDDELFLTETFGPIVGITTYSTFDEAIALGNKPGYGLSSSIYTTDPNICANAKKIERISYEAWK